MFKRERISIVDEGYLCSLTTSWMLDSVEQANGLVQEDKQITVTDTDDKLDISCWYVYSIIHKTSDTTEFVHGGYQNSLQMSTNGHPWKYGEAFLQWTVTGNETWVHHYEPVGKCQSIRWKHMSLHKVKKFGSVPSAGKVMLMLIGLSFGPTGVVDI